MEIISGSATDLRTWNERNVIARLTSKIIDYRVELYSLTHSLEVKCKVY